MTNNPTIDGVSPELRELLERVVGKPTGKPNWDALDETRIAASDELRALLDAPAVERQPAAFLYETAMKCTENSEGRVYSGFLPSLGVSLPSVPEDSLRNIRPLYEVAPEVAALQSTIARLEARVAELESGMGDVARYERWYQGTWFEVAQGDVERFEKDGWKIRRLYTAPPAPVAVVLPKYTCIGKGGEYELMGSAIGAGTLKEMSPIPVYRDTTTRQLFVRTPLDFSTRMACLDATAALNTPQPAEWHDVAGDDEGLAS